MFTRINFNIKVHIALGVLIAMLVTFIVTPNVFAATEPQPAENGITVQLTTPDFDAISVEKTKKVETSINTPVSPDEDLIFKLKFESTIEQTIKEINESTINFYEETSPGILAPITIEPMGEIENNSEVTITIPKDFLKPGKYYTLLLAETITDGSNSLDKTISYTLKTSGDDQEQHEIIPADWDVECDSPDFISKDSADSKIINYYATEKISVTENITFRLKTTGDETEPAKGDALNENKNHIRIYKADDKDKTTVCSGEQMGYLGAKDGKKRLTTTIPANVLEFNTTYVLEVAPGFRGKAIGNKIPVTNKTYNFIFTTESDADKVVFQQDLININEAGAGFAPENPILIGFNKQVAETSESLKEKGLELQTKSEKNIEISCDFSNDGKLMTIQPVDKLSYGLTYSLKLPSFTSAVEGEVIEPKTITFTTTAFKKPEVTISQLDQVINSIVIGGKYTISAYIKNLAATQQDAKLHIVIRGGKGAREDNGGNVIQQNIILINNIAPSEKGYGTIEFTLPDYVLENIYIDVYTTTVDGIYANSEGDTLTIPVIE